MHILIGMLQEKLEVRKMAHYHFGDGLPLGGSLFVVVKVMEFMEEQQN